jgi:hypothetical protein
MTSSLAPQEAAKRIPELIANLKRYDDAGYSEERRAELEQVKAELVSIGEPAVPQLLETLGQTDSWSSYFAADALGEICDERAIIPLVDTLEEPELGERAKEALKKFGPVCIPEVIRKVEQRIAQPVEEERAFISMTAHALSTVGEIRCEESIQFLNNLLDDYMSELPEGPFDPTKRDWKYRNVDFFHLLDCMVRQQDKRAIPHIQRARDFFPEETTDYLICQIAIGRIRKGRVEGYLPMEALEIAYPTGAILDA